MTQKDQREREAREYVAKAQKEMWRSINRPKITAQSTENTFLAGCQSEARRVVEWCEKHKCSDGFVLVNFDTLKREFGETK